MKNRQLQKQKKAARREKRKLRKKQTSGFSLGMVGMTPEEIKASFKSKGIDIQQKLNGHFIMTPEIIEKLLELKEEEGM